MLFASAYLYLQGQGNNLHQMLHKFSGSLFLLAPQRRTQQRQFSQPGKDRNQSSHQEDW